MLSRPERLADLIRASGAVLGERLPPLEDPLPLSSLQPPDSSDKAESKKILVSQRVNHPLYRTPSEQKRGLFRSKSKNESLSNPDTWDFSHHEIGKAIATLFEAGSLERTGIIQALLQLKHPASVEHLWECAQNSNLEKRRRRSAVPKTPCPWLQQATIRNSIDLIVLLSSCGCGQTSLDESLGLALHDRHFEAARELLRYGASLDSHQEYLFESVRKADLEMVNLWLLAPKAVQKHTDEVMRLAIGLRENVKDQEKLLSLLLGNISISSKSAYYLLLGAIKAQNQKSVAALLMVALNEKWDLFADCSNEEMIKDIEASAIRIPDVGCRQKILDLILSADMRADSSALRDELLRSVRDKDIELMKVLILHGTRQDSQDAAALNWAVENASLDALEAFRSATVSAKAASYAIDRIPASSGEPGQIKMVDILTQKGANGPPLARHLLRALERRQSALIEKLLIQGAAIDFQDAAAVRFVLKDRDLTLLERMLNLDCSPVALCHALPDAMSISPKKECFQAVSVLLTKGVEGDKLHMALLDAVKRKDESRDVDLIQLLIRHRASVNFSVNGANCIHAAAERVDVKVLEYLCASRPSADIVLDAIPLAFGSLREENEGQVLKALSTLLQTGAKGDSIGSTLVKAIAASRLQIAKLLLQHSISQHHLGQAIQEALKSDSLGALRLLCKLSLPKQILQKYVHEVLHGGRYNQEKARLLLEASRAHMSVLDQSLGSEELRKHSHRHEIIQMLLVCGADVDVNSGAVVRFAVQVGDIELAKLLLSSNPCKSTLVGAFGVSTELSQKAIRLWMMGLLLEAATSEDIGQNEALIQETRDARTTDSAIVELLLQHNASVDFDSGAALKEAVLSQSIPLLKLLLAKVVNMKSLSLPLVTASVAGSLEMLDLLMSYCPTSSSVEAAFRAARMATLDESMRLSVFQRLLQPGELKSEQLSLALIESVKRNPNLLDIPLVFLLLRYGADVNVDNCECFVIATKSDDTGLFKSLLAQGVDCDTLLNRLIMLGMEEDKLLCWLGIVLDQPSAQVKIQNKFDLISVLRAYPVASSLVAFLLGHGCRADLTFQNRFVQETTTALIWALDEREPGRERICDSVILELLAAASKGINVPFQAHPRMTQMLIFSMLAAYVDFVTKKSQASAIIHTVKSGRISVLERLVALNADLSVRDANKWTPLCHASANRDEKAVSILIQAGTTLNDSSLHLAAKMAYPNIVSILLSAGHHPRYPSVVHQRMIPLACLCLESYENGQDWELRLQQTLELLIPVTDLKWRANGKSLLHFALDNGRNACEVTEGFLRVAELWKSSSLNDEYMFKDDREYFYSPTRYVKLLCSKGMAEKHLLIELLYNTGFTDRYYTELGDQPEGAVGFPPEIEAQLKAEWEKEKAIQRQNEIAANGRRLLDETHEKTLIKQLEQDENERRLIERRHNMQLKKHEELLKLQRGMSEIAMERELTYYNQRLKEFELRMEKQREQLQNTMSRAQQQETSLLRAREQASRSSY